MSWVVVVTVDIGFIFFAFALASASLGSFSTFRALDHLLLDKPRFDELVAKDYAKGV
jgi:hypothetical protein